MSNVSHDVNSALTEILGENIGSIIKKLASIQEVAHQMNDELGDGAGDWLDSELFDLIDCLTEALQCYIRDAIDAQILKNDFEELQAEMSEMKNGQVINSPKVINSPSEKFQRKGK